MFEHRENPFGYATDLHPPLTLQLNNPGFTNISLFWHSTDAKSSYTGKDSLCLLPECHQGLQEGQEINTYLGHEGKVQFVFPFGEHFVSIDDTIVMKTWHNVSKGIKLYD